jgi:hypothetical protein
MEKFIPLFVLRKYKKEKEIPLKYRKRKIKVNSGMML